MREERIELAGLRFASNRSYGGEGEIKILAEDIKRNGLINPITVKPGTDDVADIFEVVAGRRRVLAVTQLGWKDIPCRILEADEIERAEEIAGSENINRLAMHPLDEAKVFAQLLETGRSLEDLAKQYDRKVSEIWQRVQLLDLDEGIKTLFREGKISLHTAAMLKSLDSEQQKTFYEKYKNDRNKIETWEVSSFISKIRQDKLYNYIAGKDCAKCAKRTFYSDKQLFPELKGGEDDLCLDHDCYIAKWQKLLSAKIKIAKVASKDHADVNIIACEDDSIKKIFGKSMTVDGIEYTVKRVSWDARPEATAKKGYLPCIYLKIEHYREGDKEEYEINTKAMYWRDTVKEKKPNDPQEDPFKSIVKLLDMPKEMAEQSVAIATEKCDKKNKYSMNSVDSKARDIRSKVKDRVFDQVIGMIAKKPDDENVIDLFLEYFISRQNSGKDRLKQFLGTSDIKSLRKLPVNKLFAALYVTTFDSWSLPDFDDVDKPGKQRSRMMEFAGVTNAEIKTMYQDVLKAIMPKPKVAAEKPADDKKPAKKKLPDAKSIKKVNAAKAKPVKKAPVKKSAAKGKKKKRTN